MFLPHAGKASYPGFSSVAELPRYPLYHVWEVSVNCSKRSWLSSSQRAVSARRVLCRPTAPQQFAAPLPIAVFPHAHTRSQKLPAGSGLASQIAEMHAPHVKACGI